MNTTIVTDGAKLNKLVTDTIVQMKKTREMLHIAALSVMFHALVHGDCSLMNRLFGAFEPNNRDAFRRYWKRLSWEITKDAESNLVRFDKDAGFSIIRNDQNPQAAAWKKATAAFVTDRLLNNVGKWSPDATGSADSAVDIVPFYMTNNIRDMLTDWNGKSVYKGLKALVEKSQADKAPGGGKVDVSRHILAAVEKALAEVDRLVNNDAAVDRAKADKADKPVSVAKARRKTNAKNAKANAKNAPVDQPSAGI